MNRSCCYRELPPCRGIRIPRLIGEQSLRAVRSVVVAGSVIEECVYTAALVKGTGRIVNEGKCSIGCVGPARRIKKESASPHRFVGRSRSVMEKRLKPDGSIVRSSR